MDFEDTPDEAGYRAQVRSWLADNAPAGFSRRRVREDIGPDELRGARAWQAKKADAGYACITWPIEWGGAGGTTIQSVIFAEEEARHPVPANPFHIGLDMCVPTVLAHSDAETRARFSSRARRGDEIWCQLFSEPAGGSDLAAVRTRAVREDDGLWLVNGQKTWTTGAHLSDFGLLLCRTDPEARKHDGLTMFWVDLKAPGIEVRPIREMDGSEGFNEVFFTEARIPDTQRLGEVGQGWKIALYTLMHERLAADQSGAGWSDFVAMARRTPWRDGQRAITNPALREKLADWYVEHEGLRNTRNRALTALSRGETPGPESSIIKLVRASQMLDMANTAIEMLDAYGIVESADAPAEDAMMYSSLMWAPGLRIAGGTDEILRNIIAERVLGMPAEIRVDKGIAFKDIPIGR